MEWRIIAVCLGAVLSFVVADANAAVHWAEMGDSNADSPQWTVGDGVLEEVQGSIGLSDPLDLNDAFVFQVAGGCDLETSFSLVLTTFPLVHDPGDPDSPIDPTVTVCVVPYTESVDFFFDADAMKFRARDGFFVIKLTADIAYATDPPTSLPYTVAFAPVNEENNGSQGQVYFAERDSAVPEPTAIAIWGFGACALGLMRRRRATIMTNCPL